MKNRVKPTSHITNANNYSLPTMQIQGNSEKKINGHNNCNRKYVDYEK
jgi:hypothetical protein